MFPFGHGIVVHGGLPFVVHGGLPFATPHFNSTLMCDGLCGNTGYYSRDHPDGTYWYRCVGCHRNDTSHNCSRCPYKCLCGGSHEQCTDHGNHRVVDPHRTGKTDPVPWIYGYGTSVHGASVHGASVRSGAVHGASVHGGAVRGASVHGRDVAEAKLRVAEAKLAVAEAKLAAAHASDSRTCAPTSRPLIRALDEDNPEVIAFLKSFY